MTELSIFLAHALAMECQAAERYRELAQKMDCGGNLEIAALFGKMCEFSEMHAGDIRRSAALQGKLPLLRPDQFSWAYAEPPEVGDIAPISPNMTPPQALRFALANEERGRRYYSDTSLTAADEQTRAMASQFADEEAHHVQTLERWLNWAEDME